MKRNKFTVKKYLAVFFLFLGPFLATSGIAAQSNGLKVNFYVPSEAFQGQRVNFIVQVNSKDKKASVEATLYLPDRGKGFEYKGPSNGNYNYQSKKGTINLATRTIKGREYFVFKNIYIKRDKSTIGKKYPIMLGIKYEINGIEHSTRIEKKLRVKRGTPTKASPNVILLLSLPILTLVIGAIIFLWLHKFIPESKF